MRKEITVKAEDHWIPCKVYLLYLYCTQYAFNRGEDNKGLFTWKEEDPKKDQEDPRMRNNFSLGLPYAEISVRDYSLNNVPPF